MRFYIDEDVHEQLAEQLSAIGHDTVNARQAGNRGRRDPWQFAFATLHRRTLVTANRRDFDLLHEAWIVWSDLAIATATGPHPGILVVPNGSELGLERLARIVDEFAQSGTAPDNRLFRWHPKRGWHQPQPGRAAGVDSTRNR